MTKIRFSSEIWKTGNSYVVTIPKQYVKDGWVKAGNTHMMELETTPKTSKQTKQAEPTSQEPSIENQSTERQTLEEERPAERPDYV